MKKLLAVFSMALSIHLGNSQEIGLNTPVIFPEQPTENDSVSIALHIYFTVGGGAAWKLSDSLLRNGDSFQYDACYFCDPPPQSSSNIYDTIRLGQLSTGTYHVKIIAKYPYNNQDIYCSNAPPEIYDTIDTFFVVSPVSSINRKDETPFYALVVDEGNILLIVDYTGAVTISVFDASGRMYGTSKQANIPPGKQSVDIALPVLPAGIYFYEITAGEKRSVVKWVKW